MSTDGWFWEDAGQRRGPLPLDEMRRMVRSGVVTPATPVWTPRMPQPVPAGQLPVLREPPADSGGLGLVIPVRVSWFALVAGYLGILSIIPGMSIFAILFAGLAIWDLKRHPEKTGWVRVGIGLSLAVLFGAAYLWAFST